MRPHGSPAELERRRLHAMTLVQEGHSLNEAARRLGCNASSVKRWRDAFRRGGRKALRPKPACGRPPKLGARQRRQLVRYLLQGALAHGYQTDLWTTQRIAEVIAVRFGVQYHRDHVGRLMHSLKWSCQKPERRAIERDEQAIEAWKRRDWPRIKKTPGGWAPISSSSTNRASS